MEIQTRDLPDSSAVLQPIAPPHTLWKDSNNTHHKGF